MSLEEFTPDIESSEWWDSWAEAISEKASEKAKEDSKKSAAGQARTQKDEKKAKKHDFLLAGFLVKIIINQKYDSILNTIFGATSSGFSSNFILWLLSLINIESSDKIREMSGKEKIEFSYMSEEAQEFDDHHMAPAIKDRINNWVEDIIDILTIDYSHVATQQLINSLSNDAAIRTLTKQIFNFFLNEINITISDAKAENICDFILWEIKKEISKLEIQEI